MKHLIDKDALVAEIRRMIKNAELYIEHHSDNNDRLSYSFEHQRLAMCELLSFLDTLEVKEVDLGKEYDNEFFKDPVFGKLVNRNAGISIAKYFFELGIKAQKMQDEIKIGETEIYLEDDGGEPPYDGIQWLDLSCMEYEIPKDKFKDGDNVEIIIRKTQKGE